MGGPTSWATINFPVKAIDAEIKDCLEKDYYLKFDENGPVVEDTPDGWVEVEKGIFGFHETDLNDGEFADLEKLLREKGIPFDRETGMEWEIAPHKQIFRPNLMDRWIPLDGDGQVVVRLDDIQEIIEAHAEKQCRAQLYGALTYFLSVRFDYPSLEDLIKEAENHG